VTWMMKNGAQPHRDMPSLLMPGAERQHRSTARTHRAVADRAVSLCLHRLIEEQTARTPHLAAVVCEEQVLTYAELNARADALAHYLRLRGAGPDVLVGLFVERSVDMVAGILGILKAGAAYVPIDPAYPQERVAFMLADAGVTLLLTHGRLLAYVQGTAAEVIDLDRFDWTSSERGVHEAADVEPTNLAYVIYTSGSTGRPKGVCIEHRNIVNYAQGITQRLRLEPGMRHATVTTIAADLGNTVIFPSLISGGCLHVISQERAESQAALADYFDRERIDVLKIVPSHLAALQSGHGAERVMPKRRLVLGGEPSRLDWIARLRAQSPDCEIFNHYGPTETTVGALMYQVGAELPDTPSGTLPLGTPLPNTRISIVDEAGQPVPFGDYGELCIGGGGVARGYLNRAALTAERFIPDPASSDPAERLYRTGDRVRLLPDGNVEFGGRFDDQVKIHGYRVELGEIEATLRAQPGVRDAVVLAHEDEASGDRKLAAYVVPTRVSQPLWECSAYVLPDGSPVAHLNKNETDYIYHEIFVLQAYLRHGITVRDGDCIVDAGANIGLFTVFVSRLAQALRVIAFEPNPAAFACLNANAQAWGTAVKCIPHGLSRENTSAELTFFQGLSLLSGFYADAATEREVVKNYVLNQHGESLKDERSIAEIKGLIDDHLQATTVSAQLRTLSSVIAEERIERIDLLKINVEKSELDVLLGLSAADWPKIRQLVIEVDRQQNLAPITTLLERQGFEVLVEQDPLLRKTELCYVYAIRPSPAARLIRDQAQDAPVRSLPAVDHQLLSPPILRQHLKARLPQYMIPTAFVLLDKLPLTANGKVDRRALAQVSHRNEPAIHEHAGPHTETERALLEIWIELLKVQNIGVHDDFFDLGGHSLLAMQAISRVRDVFDVDLPLGNLVERPTVAELAEAIDVLSWLRQNEGPLPLAKDREQVEL
jgi:amino acid adenylation domain-containing protein/FkbM family methyltransferase